MGQPDLFAKHTFAQETAALTRGAVTWKDPPEISLTHVQGDGRLLVRRSARLPRLDPPWSYVRGHDEIQLEIKMVQYTAMSISARAQVIKSIEVEDAEVVARQRHLVQLLIAQHPEFQEELNAAQRKEDRKDARKKGRLAEARIILQRVLARRGFELGAEDEARIDACMALATLEHWIDEAVVASSAAEAMGLPRRA